MTTASWLLGATAAKFIPAEGRTGSGSGLAVGAASVLHAASAEPAPTASTVTPVERSNVRRDTRWTTSPKYSFALPLGTGWEHASPHLYRQVTCWRAERPSCRTNRFKGTSDMRREAFRRLHRPGCGQFVETYGSLLISCEALGERSLNAVSGPGLRGGSRPARPAGRPARSGRSPRRRGCAENP